MGAFGLGTYSLITDANTVVTTGLYTILAGGTNHPNAGSSPSNIIHINNSVAGNATQFLVSLDVPSKGTYYRAKISGTWEAWTKHTIAADLSVYALLISPTFTGVPLAPTATGGTNTTQIATTAFVTEAIDDVIATIVAGKIIAKARFTGAGSITYQYGVASVTRTSVGKYDIVLDAAATGTNYVVSVTAAGASGLLATVGENTSIVRTDTTFSIQVIAVGVGFYDLVALDLVVFDDN